METIPLHALLLEDSESDAQLLLQALADGGFTVQSERVYTKQGMLNALGQDAPWDVIISEHQMPGFSSTDTLLALLGRGLEIPLIIVSDHMAEEVAIETVRAGAHDFLNKDNLSRLGVTITKALQAAQSRAEAKAYQQRLRELSVHQEEVRESERVHIARDVHDELGGMLTAIKMDVRQLQKRCGDCEVAASPQFQQLGEHIDTAINTVRRIITDLRPSVLDDLGLVAALEWQLNEFEKRHQIECHFINQAAELSFDENAREVAVFRIFQEALTNIAKHAAATRVEVRVRSENNTLLLEVNDNGVGISEQNKSKKGHYGILGMNERILAIGGSLAVGAAAAGGTRVSLSLPLQQEGK